MNELTVKIIAPTGRDAELLLKFLQEEGIGAGVVSDPVHSLTEQERDDAGSLLVAEEALHPDLIASLGRLLGNQPSWSDLPFLLLTASGRETPANRKKQAERLPLGNLTVLERPLRPSSLLSAVQSALRARRRQHEVRDSSRALSDAYASLRMSEERNRLILQSTHDCIKLLDLDGNLLSMNEEGQRRLGVKDIGSICGTSWPAFWRGPDMESAKSAVASALAGTAGHFEGFYETPDGEATWWDISVTPVRDGDGKIINLLAVSREITNRKLTEQALIQSEKLAAVGRLVSTISHEINNPLEAVTNLVYLALHDKRLHQEIAPWLTAADDELRRASQIVGQTLRFHRQSTHPKKTTPEELVASVITLYGRRLKNFQIVIETRHEPNVSLICFEGEIRQALNNLVGNAIEAMRGGGRLLIRTRRANNSGALKDGICITIADTGHGMEPAVARRIFEAFFTTRGDTGNGLGLWITKGIVEKHRGYLTMRTRLKKGTIFRLFLPPSISPIS